MNKKFRVALLLALFVVFVVLVLWPVKSYSATYLPGFKGGGPYGDTCVCPSSPVECGCTILDEIPR
ncbi:MAG: hypothetical protein ACM3SY_21785 [Candidatus Omnitrophota bacterium]